MATQDKSILKGLFAGAIGGAVGTLVLNTFQSASLQGTQAVENRLPGKNTYTGQQRDLLEQFNQAHAKTAEVVASAAGHPLSSAGGRAAVPTVEYAFGILCGAIYGAFAEYVPSLTSGFGTTYGAALFTGASEVVLPALGWVPQPSERTPVQHLGGLSGNVVYGAVTEGSRRLVRKALS